MSYNNSRTFMQKHGLKIGVGVVSLIILIVVIVMLTGKKEEDDNFDLSPSPSAADEAVAFLQNTDQSDIDGTADGRLPRRRRGATCFNRRNLYDGYQVTKPPLDYYPILNTLSNVTTVFYRRT